MLGKRKLRGDRSDYDNDKVQDGAGERSKRATRLLPMSEDEWAARERRRVRSGVRRGINSDKEQETKESSNLVAGQREIRAEGNASESPQEPPASTPNNKEREPWESLVIGNLGENLSLIERKDREIKQQRFIVQYHEKNSPHQVEHNRKILDRLVQERDQMEDKEENNIPEYVGCAN